jgi:heme exporter protein A
VASRQTTNALLGDRGARTRRTAHPAVDLLGVTRVFGAVPAVVRVDLRIDPGEMVLVRGPNGAGKSTLLRLVATALSPTYGRGSVLGLDLVRQRGEIRSRIELIGHRSRLYEDLTGRENLRFACTLYGSDTDAVDETLERVGLNAVADERVREYSQGMRQRVAVGRAFLRAPELLLLDEPYAGLDVEAKDVVDSAIRASQRSGRTVVLATHDPARGGMASRTLTMEAGRLLPEDGAVLATSAVRSGERS